MQIPIWDHPYQPAPSRRSDNGSSYTALPPPHGRVESLLVGVMLELRPRGIPAIVYRRRADGGRVGEDVDALAAAAVQALAARCERVRHGAARVAVREVPEAADLGGGVVAARPVGHLAAGAERKHRVRRAGRERTLCPGRRRRRDARALRLGEEVQPLRVVVRVWDRRADHVPEGLRRVALLALRCRLVALVSQPPEPGYDQR